MTAPFLVFGIGNDARGDDALGPLLLRRLKEAADPAWVEFVETYQLQVENALDLVERQWVLFIDAGMDTPDPFDFYPTRAMESRTPFSHALPPEAVLAVHEKISGAPPPAHVLCVRGEDFELGRPLSPKAAIRLDAAFDFAIAELTNRMREHSPLGKSPIPG